MSERAKRLCDCRVAPTMIAQGWESEMIGDVTGSSPVRGAILIGQKCNLCQKALFYKAFSVF